MIQYIEINEDLHQSIKDYRRRINMTQTELNEILRLHKLWLKNDPSGKRADLSNQDLSGLSLLYADLTDADLTSANLTCADLRCTSLTNAILTGADLTRADLTDAKLDKVKGLIIKKYKDLQYPIIYDGSTFKIGCQTISKETALKICFNILISVVKVCLNKWRV